MSSLYIHIPFCRKGCHYCDFYKVCNGTPEQMEAYIGAVEKEMELRRDFLKGSPITTIFFGGGTPSVYHPSKIQRLIDKARSLWDLSGLVEVSIEINPDDANEEYLTELAKTDVNRVSFGVQSFVDEHLVMLNRRHNAQQATDAIRMAREKGFRNISVDLMYGLPGMSLKEWDRNIMHALALGVEHISAYSLTVEPGTRLASMIERGELEPVEEAAVEAQYLLAHKLLTQSGGDHYEISNYAKSPEYRSKHNCNYWCGATYLGVGASSHSYDGNQRVFGIASLEDYLIGVGTESIYGREMLSKVDKYNEFIMTSLRTCCGVRRDVMTERFGVDNLLYFEYCADKYIDSGLIVHDHNEYKIPPEKYMVSDAIIRDLFIDSDE